MSELNITFTSRDLRWQLLATVSALALVSYSALAKAEDSDRPTLWIELGGQAERMPSVEDSFTPPFSLRAPRPFFEGTSPLSVEHPPRYAIGGEGKLTFQPTGSDWVFTAAIRYGRSNGGKHVHNQANIPTVVPTIKNVNNLYTPVKFNDGSSGYRETHSVLDFAVGRDVGLGLFGDAVASLGVRYAQFSTETTVSLSSKPDFIKVIHPGILPGKYSAYRGFHDYTANAHAERSFHGVGPSLSFSGNVPIARQRDGDSLTFDWGLNGALLFGRQRATAAEQTHGLYQHATKQGLKPTYNRTNGHATSRSVTVPNIGGLAGISYRFPNAKLSLGYRADFFFGAMDRGLDARESATMGFHGPFATVSIGLGG